MARRSRNRGSTWRPVDGATDWFGAHVDPYEVPEVEEPNYEHYKFRSRLGLSPDEGSDDLSHRIATERQIKSIQRAPIVVSPFVEGTTEFGAPEPQMPVFAVPPENPLEQQAFRRGIVLEEIPPEPQRPNTAEASYSILGIPIRKLNEAATNWRQQAANQEFAVEYRAWQQRVKEINKRNETALTTHKEEWMATQGYKTYLKNEARWAEQRAILDRNYKDAMLRWWSERQKFEESSQEEEQVLDSLKSDFFDNAQDAIETTVRLALRNAKVPWRFAEEPMAHFDEVNNVLLITLDLPDFDRVAFYADEAYTKVATKTKAAELKDIAFYGIVVAVLHDVSVIVKERPIDGIALNGTVTFIDKATGQERKELVVSVFARKEELLALNLPQLDPKTAFKALKGVSAGTLAGYVAVAPIMELSAEDRRVVEGRQVIDSMQHEENIASMRWEDFEHLIRELFEKEFSAKGMEVKVTRASRDSGVDAIAFDPDPVSGGKLVIQAKRYTRTVDVSAVRDLFGTVQSEGANKGILVTTSKYGPDSHAFARGKPITLLDGSNLLALLSKHGYRFTIDLDAARKELKEKGWL